MRMVAPRPSPPPGQASEGMFPTTTLVIDDGVLYDTDVFVPTYITTTTTTMPLSDDDDDTITITSSVSMGQQPQQQQPRKQELLDPIIYVSRVDDGEDDDIDIIDDVLENQFMVQQQQIQQHLFLDGYLYKLNRNGKWQRRFFECDGECLAYYKSSKRTKLLATLDLSKVGTIAVSPNDPCVFHISVADRPYVLLSQSEETCREWVIALNRTKTITLEQWRWNRRRTQKFITVDPNGAEEGPKNDDSGGDGNDRFRIDPTINDGLFLSSPPPSKFHQNYYHYHRDSHRSANQWQKMRRHGGDWKRQQIRVVSFLRRCAKSVQDAACQDPTDQIVVDAHTRYPNKESAREAARRAEMRQFS